MRILLVIFLLCAGPAMAQPRPDPAKGELEQLLTALPMAPSDEVAARIEMRVSQLWLKAGGPAAGLLIARGTRNLQSGAAAEAVQDFDAALVLAPNLPEVFGRRALARYQAGDVSGAIRDLEAAVQQEPRNFTAWRTLSTIAEAQGNSAGALAAWRKLLEIDPKTAGAQARLKDLTRKAEGEEM
jgi:tetratricopeptide (TPR) repeat protein